MKEEREKRRRRERSRASEGQTRRERNVRGGHRRMGCDTVSTEETDATAVGVQQKDE